jgi:hypothetical protein
MAFPQHADCACQQHRQKEHGHGDCDARRRHGAARLRAETSARPAYKGGSSKRYTSGGRLQRADAILRESDFSTTRFERKSVGAACAASGQEDAADTPPSIAMNWRRFIDHLRYSFFLFERTVTGVTICPPMLV